MYVVDYFYFFLIFAKKNKQCFGIGFFMVFVG